MKKLYRFKRWLPSRRKRPFRRRCPLKTATSQGASRRGCGGVKCEPLAWRIGHQARGRPEPAVIRSTDPRGRLACGTSAPETGKRSRERTRRLPCKRGPDVAQRGDPILDTVSDANTFSTICDA